MKTKTLFVSTVPRIPDITVVIVFQFITIRPLILGNLRVRWNLV